MLKLCNEQLGEQFKLPLSKIATITFVGWMLDRGLAAATISSYLAGIRQKQISLGLETETLRTPFINQIITGKKNQEAAQKIAGEGSERLPITPATLLLIKKDLKLSNLSNQTQLLVWSACTLLFFGAFRGGEILAKREKTFDPQKTLLGQDISLKTLLIKGERILILQVKLKSEKTNRSSQATIVDVYASNNNLCPVAAWKKWANMRNRDPLLPAFMVDAETALTCKSLNRYLADVNRKYFNIPGKTLSCHCFRAGMATLLAKIGYSDEEIQTTGRWSSRAFQDYIKLPRTARISMAREIAKLNL